MPPVIVVPPPLMLTWAVLSASSTPVTIPPPEKLNIPFWPIPKLPLIRSGLLLRLMVAPCSPNTANLPAAPSALQMLGLGQVKVAGLNAMFIVFSPTNVAAPEKAEVLLNGPSGFVTVVAKVPLEGALKEIESVMVVGVPDLGVAVNV